MWPEKFNNKTNGVTPRRWVDMCNPGLSALLTRLSGSDSWVTNLGELKELRKYADDDAVMNELMSIKKANKADFATWIHNHQGAEINPDTIFDVQIKRLHEYKRQLMNALYILDVYFRITEDGEEVPPRTFIFGAKAAPGYVRAKAIIKLINTIADLVNNDERTRDIIRVVFVENYNVSPAEHIIPAADISEQISTAGKEASGTSNMKFMMNGALTLGTLDGANVEIVESVGEENAYIFGAKNEELPGLKETYNPGELYSSVPGLSRVLDALTNGTLGSENTGVFGEIRSSLLDGFGPHAEDTYYVLGDFADYRETRDRMANDYVNDELSWLASAGSISANPAASPQTAPSPTMRRMCGRLSQPLSLPHQLLPKPTSLRPRNQPRPPPIRRQSVRRLLRRFLRRLLSSELKIPHTKASK